MATRNEITQFLGGIKDKRISSALISIADRTLPINKDTGLTAHAGGTKAAALALNAAVSFHDVTTVATAADSILLPPAKEGEFHFVKNSGAASMQVFGQGTDTVDSVATATGVAQLAGDAVLYVCLVDGNYIRLGGVQATEAFGDITADNLTMANPIIYDHNTTITAFASGGQASATALTGEFNNVTTCATAGDSVKLPAAALGKSITVKNSGAASLAVFPATGDAINALAANLSVNIPVSGMTTFRAIDGTTYETNEVFVSSGPTTQRGEFVFKASDNAADHEVILTNASHGQATTTTVPDPGGATGTVVLEEITNVFDLPQRYDANTTITAFATGGQASATALTGEFNNITTVATAGDSVKLPAAAAGLKITVKNSGAASLAVFPATSDSINALAVDLSVNIPVGGELTFRAKDATVWETNEALVLSAPTTQSGELVVKAADNAADHEIIVTNASHGQATTHTIPDPGAASASFVLTEGTQTINGAKTITNISSIATAVEAAEHGAGAIGTSSFGAPQTYRWIENGIIVTQIKFDLTGLASVATANDVIGLSAGGAAYIGRNVVATNGVIFKTSIAVLETPTGGDNDVNVVTNASAVLAYDGAGGTTYLVGDLGDLLVGKSVENLVPALTEGDYFYLTAGTGDTAAAYTAGQYIVTLYGHAVL